jgi:hypothetical protein
MKHRIYDLDVLGGPIGSIAAYVLVTGHVVAGGGVAQLVRWMLRLLVRLMLGW